MPARKKSIFTVLPVIIFILTASFVLAAPGKTVDATKVGVVGDGATVNTVTIQKAIDACSADGGRTIQFPAGRYVSGTIQLKDNVTLRLDENAIPVSYTHL